MILTCSTLADVDMEVLIKNCEDEAQKILDYMSINRLKANDDKTGIVIVKKKKSDETLTLKIGNGEVEETKNERLLGIMVDQNLKWDCHIKNLVRKLNIGFSL